MGGLQGKPSGSDLVSPGHCWLHSSAYCQIWRGGCVLLGSHPQDHSGGREDVRRDFPSRPHLQALMSLDPGSRAIQGQGLGPPSRPQAAPGAGAGLGSQAAALTVPGRSSRQLS